MNSNYLSSSKTKTKTAQKALAKIICLFVVAMSVFALSGFSALKATEQKADAFDPIQWIACRFGDDSVPRFIYQVTQTSDIQFQLFSKSYVGSGASDVRGGLNGILDYIKTEGRGDTDPNSFQSINETIIGQRFDGSLSVEKKNAPWLRWNRGPEVNPYDRFGVAGLTFSNYMGEWKHLFIDACDDADKPGAKFDTGAATNVVKVATWNVCSGWSVCNMPAESATITCESTQGPTDPCSKLFIEGQDPNDPESYITTEDVWGPESDWEGRANLAYRTGDRKGEMVELDPDVLLLQEASAPNTTDYICKEMGTISPKNANPICYNKEKFTAVSNDQFKGSQGSVNFASTATPGYGSGYSWAVLEDSSFRRSVFVSVHTKAHSSFEEERRKQTQYMVDKIKAQFAGSFYPIVIGGDFNSGGFGTYLPEDPDPCSKLTGNRLETAKVMCAAGYIPTELVANVKRDLYKATFQGYSPWKSSGANSVNDTGSHIDHIYVNSYIGVGEARVFAPAGIATSDHAIVGAVLNLNGTSVAQPGDPQDPGTNKYYDTRKEPKSTWEDISTSNDIRTLQFSKGFGDRFASAISMNVTNFIFFFTKLIVVFTIAFIGLAFSDLGELLKINDIIVGSNGNTGIFQQLHNNVFIPLIIIAIAATGVHLFWTAIVKRQIRSGLGSTFKVVLTFIAAIIISVSPAWFIALPNNVAIVGQSIVASSLNNGLTGGNGLCSSNSAYSSNVFGTANSGIKDPTDVTANKGFLRTASLNMQSAVGCSLWYNLLLRPWSEGQFGSNYQELYGTEAGVCSTTGKADEKCIGNDKKEGINRNFSWVGDPLVPLGGGNTNGKLEFNWALLQISTQTNAHAPLVPPEDRGVNSKYSQGVAHDWWRIVDAISNYHEVLATDNACKGLDDADCKQIINFDGDSTSFAKQNTAPYPQALETNVLKEWDTWVGNNQGNRIMAAFTSIIIAALAVYAPLLFAALTAVYAIGISILMAFAPIFFLFGCWAGRGQEIFKAWVDLVINTTMKRIALGLMTIISITFVSTIIQKMNEVGYWQSMILLVFISVALFRSRHKILNAVAFAKFSSADLGQTASKMTNQLSTVGKAATGMAVATSVGGATSAYRGTGFKGGAMAGFKNQMENLSYQSSTIRAGMNTHDLMGTKGLYGKYKDKPCGLCGGPLDKDETIGRLDNGLMAHAECALSYNKLDEFTEIGVLTEDTVTSSRQVFNNSLADGLTERSTANELAVSDRIQSLTELAVLTNSEIQKHKLETLNTSDAKRRARTSAPPIPTEIKPFVDAKAIELAWEQGEYEYIKLAYTAGWVAWGRQNDIDLSDKEALKILTNVQNDNGQSWLDR